MDLTRIGLTRMGLTRRGLTRMGLTRMGLTRMGLTRMGLTRMGLTQTRPTGCVRGHVAPPMRPGPDLSAYPPTRMPAGPAAPRLDPT